MQYKQLPPNPSLEHLKSQAKQLLKGYKEGSVDALQRIRSFTQKLASLFPDKPFGRIIEVLSVGDGNTG